MIDAGAPGVGSRSTLAEIIESEQDGAETPATGTGQTEDGFNQEASAIDSMHIQEGHKSMALETFDAEPADAPPIADENK